MKIAALACQLRRLGFAAGCAAAAVLLNSAGAGAAEIGDIRLDGSWFIDEAHRRSVANDPAVRAKLTAAGQAIADRTREATAARQRQGEFVTLQAAFCGNIGVPFIIGTSEPWHLRVTKDVVVQTGERYQLSPRYFYTDGRALPDLTKLPPSSNGYSVARWEGRALVIETRGLPPGNTQGGGLKGPKTRLTERMSVDETGDRLSWTFTFEDPGLLVEPLTYTQMFLRAPADGYALFQQCDPNMDPAYLAESPPQDLPLPPGQPPSSPVRE